MKEWIMNLNFTLQDALHGLAVKFVPASLPRAEKPYHLRAAFQKELDIHELALKAAVYNMKITPKEIEDGFNAAIELMYYLTADGYRVKTPLFSLWMRIPGEYSGHEEALPEGIVPVPRLRISASFRSYLKDKVKLEFAGLDALDGVIAQARDEATGRTGEVMTRGNILTITGKGLKIDGDEVRREQTGMFFVPDSGEPVRAAIVVVNTRKTLKVLIPHELKAGESYKLAVETQCSSRGGGTLLKKVREIRSEFSLVAA
jgi:hypothetical protein